MVRWVEWAGLAGTGAAALTLCGSAASHQPDAAADPAAADPAVATASGATAAAAPSYGADTGTEVEGEAPRRLRKAETVLRRRTSRMIVVLESSYDQHNQAAVLRTCDCLGIQHIWIVDPVEEKGFHEKEQRKRSSKQFATKKAREKAEKRAADEAAMRQLVAEQSGEPVALAVGGGSGEPATAEAVAEGWRRAEANAAKATLGDGRTKMSRRISKQSAEWLSLRHFPDTPSCITALREEGYELWVTHLSQAAACLDDPHLTPFETQASKGLAVVFGREADGVSEAMVAAADRLVYFPMDGFTESLNLSVSAALVLQTILRDNSELKGAMPQEERAALRREWFLRLAKNPAQLVEYPRWASGQCQPPNPFDDLRRTEALRSEGNMIPPKIRKRLAKLEAEKAKAGAGLHRACELTVADPSWWSRWVQWSW